MLVLQILGAYLLGAIPFGLLVAKIWKIDIRRRGSGNIGATNVLRTLGFLPAAAVFTLVFGFKGGKGAATGLGVLAGIAPDIFLIAVLAAAALIFLTRYVSVASISTSILTALLMVVYRKPIPYTIAALLTAVL